MTDRSDLRRREAVARDPPGREPHYSQRLVDAGRSPDPDPGGDDLAGGGPPPVHGRTWRHPSELGAGERGVGPSTGATGPAPLHRGIVVGTAVATLVIVAGITRLLVPADADEAIVVVASTPRGGTVSPSTTGPVLGDVVPVAVQSGALYLTSRTSMGDARSVPLAVDGEQVTAGIFLVDEQLDVAVLRVAATEVDAALVEGFVDTDATLELDDDRVMSASALDDAIDAVLGRRMGRTWLGIEGIDVVITGEFAGVRIVGVVDGSPAERAGLVVDDVIVGFVDAPTTPRTSPSSITNVVHSLADLTLDLHDRAPGDEIGVIVTRGADTVEVRVRLERMPRSLRQSTHEGGDVREDGR